MERYDKSSKPNESEDESMNFDDNYNQKDFLQQQTQNQKVQKLSIMDDFSQLCQKINHFTDANKSQELPHNVLDKYYEQCKLKNEQKKIEQKTEKITQEQQKTKPSQTAIPKNNKPSPMQSQHIRSASDNHSKNQPQNTPIQMVKHQRNPSYGEGFKKKTLQQMELNDNKRNYSSVEDKKKILQPSKNSMNPQQNPSMKDYYGEENNFLNNKINAKALLKNQAKTLKDSMQHNIIGSKKQGSLANSQKFNKQNSLKQSNLMNSIKRNQTTQTEKNSKVSEKDFSKEQRPKVIMYTQRIDLTQSTEHIRQYVAMFRKETMDSDYEISNSSFCSSETGLFADAIINQRKTNKTSQTVQSPTCNYLQPTQKEPTISKKQFISSPMPISYSPNPTNMPKSIFQKKNLYR